MRAKKNLEAANIELENQLDNAVKVKYTISILLASWEVTQFRCAFCSVGIRMSADHSVLLSFVLFLGQWRIPKEREEVATASEGW